MSVSCGKSYSINIQASTLAKFPMDSACYDSTDNLILAVRGGRVYSCNAVTGAISAQSDYSQLALGAASVVWDSGSNRCFAVGWNVGHNTGLNFEYPERNIYRIVPTTLAVDQTTPITSTFSLSVGYAIEYGLSRLVASAGWIYGVGWAFPFATWSPFVLRFSAANPAVFSKVNSVGPSYPYCAYVLSGGTNDRLYWNTQGTYVSYRDFTSSSTANGPGDSLRNRMAVEYAPGVTRLYFTDEFQYIHSYDLTGAYVATIDTGRAAFNGVNIRYNSVDSRLYIAGGADNTVVVLNPATDTFTVKTGFDLPWDFVFTPTRSFCVQQGSVGLKEIT